VPFQQPADPSVKNVGLVGIEDASWVGAPASLWKRLGDKNFMHGVAGQFQATSNLSFGDGLLVECAYRLIALEAIGTRNLAPRLGR
jgi:hypothetical protein